MSERIEIRGARENTLRDIDLDLPKRAITVVTGVSGSGKSSLVFDTLAAESQRQLNELFSSFAQNRLPSYGQPDVDSFANLSAVAVIDQKRLGGGARSTVGTITDIGARLRLLFSRLGEPHVGESSAFSFNDPQGMCPECEGLGVRSVADESKLIDESKSLNDGGLAFTTFAPGGWYWRTYAWSGFFDPDKPIGEFDERERHLLLHAPAGEETAPGENAVGGSYEGVVPRFERIFLHKDPDKMQAKQRESFLRIVSRGLCPACGGTRLNGKVRASRIHGHSIADFNAMQVDELAEAIDSVDAGQLAPLKRDLVAQLRRLDYLGLGYLSLDRATGTLSGGESQRVKMVRHLGSSLTDMLYIFDEPTVGLHPRDVDRLGEMLRTLRDQGNTVVVVEHDTEVMAVADHLVDMGPGAGRAGGSITFEGDYAGLRDSDTRTGEALRRPRARFASPRQPGPPIEICGADSHNLHDVDVDVPTGILVAVTGVAGSGKSSLVMDHLVPAEERAVVVDQRAIRGSRRSSPLTFTGVLEPIRKLFAKASGAPAALFSPNSDGGCPVCGGNGVIFTDLAFMDGVTTVCERCRGRRFTEEAQSHELRGKSIADVFEMSVDDGLAFFEEEPVLAVLRNVRDVGLPYLGLGQTLTTLSGGERQRLKLATRLGGSGDVYVLDEPTTGLHPADVDALVALLNRLVDDGNSLVVIEHNLDVVIAADWVIDLGPEAGHEGGELVFTGTPEELAGADTHTGRSLASYVAS